MKNDFANPKKLNIDKWLTWPYSPEIQPILNKILINEVEAVVVNMVENVFINTHSDGEINICLPTFGGIDGEKKHATVIYDDSGPMIIFDFLESLKYDFESKFMDEDKKENKKKLLSLAKKIKELAESI
jgi:hypothetical protein